MGKEQISIRLMPETLKKVDEIAVSETRTRNNMIEVLIAEAIAIRESSKKPPQPAP
ncbi:MAG: ribbon-helix-helix protein, CopG family [Treponema sp.]|jgi:predicted transcriptional regulator|nr:ribbon-helix-helix protein, CopG family [Treponema sp.]